MIILVEPQMAENIGMCARAMANFGLSEMRLVAPRDGWPTGGGLKKGATSAASGATHILENARLYPNARPRPSPISTMCWRRRRASAAR